MAMPDLEDPQDKWEVKEVLDKCQIKNKIHYLIKQTSWPSEYNFYKPVAYLAKAPKAIAAYEQKQKCKHKCKMNADEDAWAKQSCFQLEMSYASFCTTVQNEG